MSPWPATRELLRCSTGSTGRWKQVWIGSTPAPACGSFPLRARTELLKRDLLALGLEAQVITELPTCRDLPSLHEPEHFAGCLYVLEGASLGGQVITSYLRERLELTDDGGMAFFAGDGAATAARWECVLEWLEGVSHSGLRVEQIVTAACETFNSLINWTRIQGLTHEY